MRSATAVILAAGKGTRMHSELPKVLHAVADKPMLHHVISSIRLADIPRIVAVVGHRYELVTAVLPSDVLYAIQSEQKGTAHAFAQAAPLCPRTGSVLVVCGDTPLLRHETLLRLIDVRETSGTAAVMLTMIVENPTGYGRVVRDKDGEVTGVVEHRDANEAQLKIHEVNSGVFCFDAAKVFDALGRVKNDNSQGEYYLPDVLKVLLSAGEKVLGVVCEDAEEVLGVNTVEQLEFVSAILKQRQERVK